MTINQDNIDRAFKDIERGLFLMDTTKLPAVKRGRLHKLELERAKLERKIKTL